MSPFNLAQVEQELKELHAKMEAPGFWDDVEAAQKVNKQVKALSDRLEHYNKLYADVSDTLELCEMAA